MFDDAVHWLQVAEAEEIRLRIKTIIYQNRREEALKRAETALNPTETAPELNAQNTETDRKTGSPPESETHEREV